MDISDLANFPENWYNDPVKELAYKLWQEAGSPKGRDLEFWYKAEAKNYEDGRKMFVDALTRSMCNILQPPQPIDIKDIFKIEDFDEAKLPNKNIRGEILLNGRIF